MKGGYTLIDCTGLDLIKGSTEQTIPGIYAKVKAAYKGGKMIIVQNCVWDDKGLVTPINAFAIDFGTYFICTASTLQIIVTNQDKITINNLVG